MECLSEVEDNAVAQRAIYLMAGSNTLDTELSADKVDGVEIETVGRVAKLTLWCIVQALSKSGLPALSDEYLQLTRIAWQRFGNVVVEVTAEVGDEVVGGPGEVCGNGQCVTDDGGVGVFTLCEVVARDVCLYNVGNHQGVARAVIAVTLGCGGGENGCERTGACGVPNTYFVVSETVMDGNDDAVGIGRVLQQVYEPVDLSLRIEVLYVVPRVNRMCYALCLILVDTDDTQGVPSLGEIAVPVVMGFISEMSVTLLPDSIENCFPEGPLPHGARVNPIDVVVARYEQTGFGGAF